jgi:hypothetical protein
VGTLNDAELALAIDRQREEVRAAKWRLLELENEMQVRQEELAAQVLDAAGKVTGSLSFAHTGLRFKAERVKRVTWDSDKLKALAATMPWDHVEKLFDIKFTVPERIYGAIHSPELLSKLDECRTTQVGELEVKYVGADA